MSTHALPIRIELEAPVDILLVDDNPNNLLALEAILEPLRLDIVRARSGEEALRALLKHDFALILLDVQMPMMDGFETASAIKLHPRTADIPIIFVTAISREVDHVFEGYQRGAVDYILKRTPHALLAHREVEQRAERRIEALALGDGLAAGWQDFDRW